jgi:mono/diheme cytochrome c family protein
VSAGSAENGERIYLANCASCHGINGDGDGPVDIVPAGPLSDALRAMSDAEVSYRIANGLAGTAMPAFAASLTAQERRDLVTYLRERWDAP